MKKTQKRILGFFGLAFVVAMTTVAVLVPSPGASAATSVVDTLTVHVTAGQPDINIIVPEKNSESFKPEQLVQFTATNTENVRVKLTYTAQDGTVIEDDNYASFAPGEGTSTIEFTIDLASLYGYGTYQVTIIGSNSGDVGDEDSILIEYVPFTASVEEERDGTIDAVVDYDKDESTGEATGLDHIDVNVFPQGKDTPLLPESLTITPPQTSVPIPFDKIPNITTGYYDIVFKAYDENGELLYTRVVTFYYEVVETPDTGSFFQNLNISKEDYLVTGLLIFFVFGIVGIGIVTRNHKSNRHTKKRH